MTFLLQTRPVGILLEGDLHVQAKCVQQDLKKIMGLTLLYCHFTTGVALSVTEVLSLIYSWDKAE